MADRQNKFAAPQIIGAGRLGLAATAALICVASVPLLEAPGLKAAPAVERPVVANLPKPPADGVMGFVVAKFAPTFVPGMESCPDGTVPRLREMYLATLPEAEQTRLKLKANEVELTKRWKDYAYGDNAANICTNPDMFDRPVHQTVKSPFGEGMDLDGGKSDDSCAHENFTSPTGEKGIDNQEYRALGCNLEWRGKDGEGGDSLLGSQQFFSSGEWTQVILLRGVDSLVRDDDVEVIYANTSDRPQVDPKGNFLRGVSFNVSDTPPRNRNVLRGKIVNGVLTTEPRDIKLVQTWGQNSTADVRGVRSKFDFRKGRLRLEFQPDGSLKGMLGGYKPILDPIKAQVLGGAGTATIGGMDCASDFATLRKLADGVRDPKTGKCTAVSSAQRVVAIPAFINDVGPKSVAISRQK